MVTGGIAELDLTQQATRRRCGFKPGSKEEAAAIGAAEVLLDVDAVPDDMLVGDTYSTSGGCGRGQRGCAWNAQSRHSRTQKNNGYRAVRTP